MVSPLTRMRDSRVIKMDQQCCRLYAQAFTKQSADDEFWAAIRHLDMEFSKTVQDAKPLQIQAACNTYMKGFRKALLEARQRAK